MYKPKEAKLFGAALKRLLHEKGLSDRQFAKQAGLEQSYVSKLLNPKPGKEIAEPRKKTRQQLAQGLGITEQELLEQIARYSDSEAEKTISAPPCLAESEEAIAKPQRESVESDAGSIEERIFKATNQLDTDRPMFSRMSAIQALGEIAKDYPRYHWNIMEILAAFVRNNARQKKEEEERSPKIPEDIQAALTVIGQRDLKKDPDNQRLNLSNTDIKGAVLVGANLQGAIFTKTNLQGTDLKGANLQEAYLNGANLQETDLFKANLKWSKLKGANLKRANLVLANLQEAYLFGANLERACLWSANLQGVNLFEADLQEAHLSGANLQGTRLSEVNLQGATLTGVKLQGADLSGVKNLEAQQLRSTYGDSQTASSLPENVKAPEHWIQSK